jgi:hypothetical protein
MRGNRLMARWVGKAVSKKFLKQLGRSTKVKGSGVVKSYRKALKKMKMEQSRRQAAAHHARISI